MRRNLIVVDDFYDDFEGMRRRALSDDYPAPFLRSTYPGRNSKNRYIPEEALVKIQSLVGSPLHYNDKLAIGFFRRSFVDDKFEQYVHIDEGDWSGVVYLNTPEQCKANEDCGTILWRHKRTGLTEVPWDRIVNDEARKIVYGDGFDEANWDKLEQVPMKANRLVLFRARHFHSHAKNFGTTLEDARLIHLYFFREGIPEIRI